MTNKIETFNSMPGLEASRSASSRHPTASRPSFHILPSEAAPGGTSPAEPKQPLAVTLYKAKKSQKKKKKKMG